MKREIRDYLKDILDAIGEIEGFVTGFNPLKEAVKWILKEIENKPTRPQEMNNKWCVTTHPTNGVLF